MIEFQWESCVLGIFIGGILVLFVFYLIALRVTKEVETEEIDNQEKMRRLHQRDFDLLQAGFEKLNLNVNLYRDGAKANYRDLNLLANHLGFEFGELALSKERCVRTASRADPENRLGLFERIDKIEGQVASGWAEQQAICDKKVAVMRDQICRDNLADTTAAREIRKINERFNIISRMCNQNQAAIALIVPDAQDALKRIVDLEGHHSFIRLLHGRVLKIEKGIDERKDFYSEVARWVDQMDAEIKAERKKKPAAKKPAAKKTATKKQTPKRKAK